MTLVVKAQKKMLAQKTAKLEMEIHEKVAAHKKYDDLSVVKGKTPEQIEARKNVARTFCEMHLLKDTPAERDARLAAIDYTMTVMNVDARKVDMSKAATGGFLGLGGRKPAYLVSTRFEPKNAEEPIYALEYYPLKAK